jgi:hypothetical protein
MPWGCEVHADESTECLTKAGKVLTGGGLKAVGGQNKTWATVAGELHATPTCALATSPAGEGSAHTRSGSSGTGNYLDTGKQSPKWIHVMYDTATAQPKSGCLAAVPLTLPKCDVDSAKVATCVAHDLLLLLHTRTTPLSPLPG